MKLYCLESAPNRVMQVANETYVFFDVEKVSVKDMETEEDVDRWNCSYVKLLDELTYDKLVSALVCAKYTMDAQYAILANYADKGTSDEYEAFQAWRAEAKSIASEVLDAVE